MWKYVLPRPVEGISFVEMPAVIEPLSVGIQGDDLVVWAIVDANFQPPARVVSPGLRPFFVVNTGAEVPIVPGSRFLGSVTSSTGIVWHVWDGGRMPVTAYTDRHHSDDPPATCAVHLTQGVAFKGTELRMRRWFGVPEKR